MNSKGKDPSPPPFPPVLKPEHETKYQRGGDNAAVNDDDVSVGDAASLISALAFGEFSPRNTPTRPKKAAAETSTMEKTTDVPATGSEKAVITSTNTEAGKTVEVSAEQNAVVQQEVTFQEPEKIEQHSEPAHGGRLRELAGKDIVGSMAYIHQEGTQKSFRYRNNAAQVIRKGNKVDIESGESVWRQVTATPIWDFKEPMNPLERRARTVQKYAKNRKDEDIHHDDKVAQYRLHSSYVNKEFAAHRDEFPLLTSYLSWTFRASFFSVVVTDFIAFFLICCFWACCIYIGALVSPRCFVSGGQTLSDIPNWRENLYFQDAFQLSWTTFSTVGFGIVYPQVNRQDPSRNPSCAGFTFMVTLESFVGVLFAAFCGSIIFSKVARVQSIANIKFSDPLVIRYGTGVLDLRPDDPEEGGDDDSGSDEIDDEDELGESNNTNNDAFNKGKEVPSGMTDKSSASNKSRTVRFPCPVLEFRVINRLNMQKGGEIMNASVSVVASTEAARSIENFQLSEEQKRLDALSPQNLLRMSKVLTDKTGKALLRTRKATTKAATLTAKAATHATQKTGKALLAGTTKVRSRAGSIVQKMNRSIVRAPLSETASLSSFSENDEQEPEPFHMQKQLEHGLRQQLAFASLAAAAQSSRHIVCDEGNTGGLVPRRMFSKLEVDTDTHPFFKRVWIIKHVLDENSPLLTAKAQKLILANHGKWPQDICNPKFIRDNIHFHQIIVSLSGTQNSSGSDVFGMSVYEFENLNVGYTFVKMLDVNSEGKLFVDEALLNDIREQRGGGAEQIRGYMMEHPTVSAVEGGREL